MGAGLITQKSTATVNNCQQVKESKLTICVAMTDPPLHVSMSHTHVLGYGSSWRESLPFSAYRDTRVPQYIAPGMPKQENVTNGLEIS